MSNAIIDTAVLSGIADAIRDKTGETAPIKLGEMAQAIESIQGGGGEWPPVATISAYDYRYGSPPKITLSGITGFPNYQSVLFEYDAGIVGVDMTGYSYATATGSMFRSCINLQYIDNMPAAVKTIDSYFAYGCKNLQRISIGPAVTTVNQYALSACTSLEEVDFPDTLSKMGNYMFDSDASLVRVIFRSQTPPTITSSTISKLTCPIYVPRGSVDAYKSATYWSAKASLISAIPEGM